MIVRRVEDVLRIAADGSLTIPAGMMLEMCKRMNRNGKDEKGFKQDLEDFGPGRLVVLDHCQTESGSQITIQRDRRTEAARK